MRDTMRSKPLLLLLLAIGVVPLSCSGSAGQGDAIGSDVAPEATPDVGAEGPVDVPVDSAEPAPDLVADVASEVAAETAADVPPDSPPDLPPEASADTDDDTSAEVPSDVPPEVAADTPPEVSYPDLNDCSKSTATVKTGQAVVTVTFGGTAGMAYSPACLIVSTGTSVVFEGSFSFHPLAGGEAGSPDADSPFTPPTTSGSSAPFTLATPGAYGFYCGNHYASGMKGAVYVE
jgi:plastocyanin